MKIDRPAKCKQMFVGWDLNKCWKIRSRMTWKLKLFWQTEMAQKKKEIDEKMREENCFYNKQLFHLWQSIYILCKFQKSQVPSEVRHVQWRHDGVQYLVLAAPHRGPGDVQALPPRLPPVAEQSAHDCRVSSRHRPIFVRLRSTGKPRLGSIRLGCRGEQHIGRLGRPGWHRYAFHFFQPYNQFEKF